MRLVSSLRGRIFLASALLAVLSIGAAIYVVNERVTRQAESALQRELRATVALVDQLRKTRIDTYTLMARLIADLPKLKAAVSTNDPPTVEDIQDNLRDYQEPLKSANLLVVTNATGRVLATSGDSAPAGVQAGDWRAVHDALLGHETVGLLPQRDGIMQIVTVPIAIGLTQPQILGSVTVGFLLNEALASQLKAITGSDIAFAADGDIVATTLPARFSHALAAPVLRTGVSTVALGPDEYVALPLPLTPEGADGGTAPVALILRSRTEQLRSLDAIHTGLAVTALVAVLLATLLSFAVARTITRPLAAITDVMREVSATGDLTRKIALASGGRWQDEDAQLLATTYNTLTDSVARFQREISQKERLSSLGRLSTVIAHEVRNPLMIIKGSLHALRQPDLTPAAVREAVTDIDEEVERLNRIVNEVLDFSRPIRFQLAPADLNALCRESAAASLASGPGAQVHLKLDPHLTAVNTDAERLRIVLVNMLVNARHAVNGASASHDAEDASPGPLITLTTAGSDGRVAIVVADRGPGIDPAHLPHVFDPYFTTKRGGTGLGLAIAKNIVEGLGGTIGVNSTPGAGTEIRISLPGGFPDSP
jgi:two-component system nitrogen regulation sensor histidine kinase NtrY